MVLGITGCPGSGKSILARYLAESGWTLVDADRIGREVVESEKSVLDRLVESFGGDILDGNGVLNRRLLASRAFSSADKTEMLNAIVHPRLIERLRHVVGGYRRYDLTIVVDCALIFEWRIESLFDAIVCVAADEKERIRRLQDRDGRTVGEIRDMFAAQLTEEEKIRRADITIMNNGAIDRLRLFGRLVSSLPEAYR